LGLILEQLKYKTSWSDGSLLVCADRFYPSSKTCSACGTARAKLALSERVFNCGTCGLVLDRDLNAALNLAHVAQLFAQAEGNSKCYVARTERETQNARRGQIRPGTPAGLSPLKCEDPTGSTQARKGLAVAT
jgi:putative transposase